MFVIKKSRNSENDWTAVNDNYMMFKFIVINILIEW